MLQVEKFINLLKDNDVNFATGVPDSVLKDLIACIDDNFGKKNHIIGANEGSAIGIGIGYHMATKKTPLVYMQNSGLCNAMNPLISLCDELIYGIPMLLFIGYRGEKDVHDEPQHIKQGLITEDLLKIMGITYKILSSDIDCAQKQVEEQVKFAKLNNKPVAILVKKNTFTEYNQGTVNTNKLDVTLAIKSILDSSKDKVIFSTTGKISRRVLKLRQENDNDFGQDFLCVGGMGHVSQIANIFSMFSKKKIICLDGDGALLMHLGGLVTNGFLASKNFIHILINNVSHDSVGGQPTNIEHVNLTKLALSSGYKHAISISNESELAEFIKNIDNFTGHAFVNINVANELSDILPRPDNLQQRKKDFIKIHNDAN